ncbi:MAG TPA: DICT sensory domain-containing protein [Miltoncostaea sp.]|nr:DICT sensory domain-containing protein [Miltoncostaea sp.]
MPNVPSLLDLIGLISGREPRVYSRDALVTASHELEDRYGVQRRAAPLLFGGFQRARFFAQDPDRWTGFAERAAVAVVAYGADGTHAAAADPLRALVVGRDDPFWHDWVCLAYAGERRSGVLVARDRRGDPDAPAARRRCLGVLSHDHRVVRAAAMWVGHYLAGHDAELGARWRRELAEVPIDVPRRRRRAAARR